MNNTLNNRYQIIKTLGSGGFGETYLAKDTHLPSQKYCVIKQLKPVVNNQEMSQLTQERFAREATILENLGENSSQIPKLYAYFADKGKYYLIQEYIEGKTLTEIVQKQGKLRENTVQEILINILPILDYIHHQGIVHRDIKPDNIILRKRDNLPVLIDFGAVKETMGTMVISRGNSTNSIIIGTPGFMPPEQAAGRPVFSSDLYALGLVALYLLTGKYPQDLPINNRTGEFILDSFTNRISPNLLQVLTIAINPVAQNRFSSVHEMLQLLRNNPQNRGNTTYINPTVKLSAPTQMANHSNNNKTALWLIIPVIIISGIVGFNFVFSLLNQPTQNTENVNSDNEDIVFDNDENKPPENVTKIKKPSVKNALNNYYENLNNQNYKISWNLLSEKSQNDKKRHPKGYQSYLDWWQQVKNVTILNSNIIEQNDETAIIDSQLKYQLNSGKIVEQKLIFTFLWSTQEEKWLLDKVDRISETVINNSQNNSQNNTNNTDTNTNNFKSPDQFVKEHYQLINNQDYQLSWNNLSDNFKENKLKNDYQTYTKWWETVDTVEVENIETIVNDEEKATLETKVKYTMKSGKIAYDTLQMFLIKNNKNENWVIENTEKIN